MIKKIGGILLALVLIFSAAAIVNAADKSFAVGVSSVDLVREGDKITITVTVDDIDNADGIIGCDISVGFDTAVLKYESAEASQISEWTLDVNKKEAGKGKLTLAAMLDDLDGPEDDGNVSSLVVKESGKIRFELTFTVLKTDETETTFSVSDATVNYPDYTYSPVGSGQLGSKKIRIKHFLATPTGLSWDGDTARWNAVELASGYSVQLYKAGKEFGSAYESTANSYDFSSLSEAGKYTFAVTALSESEELGDSDESEKSGEHIVRGSLASPSVKLTQDTANGGLKYQITDTNPSGSVGSYEITLYNDAGEVAATVQTESKAGTFPLGGGITGGEKYTADVIAKPADGEIYDESEKSDKSSPVAAAKKVDSIAYGTAPATTYTEGTSLNLTGVTVELTYSDGTSVTVPYSDFDKYGITISPSNGKTLALSDTGTRIVATFGSGSGKKTVSSAKITVNSSACKHEKTHVDRKEPTCGEKGYENTVCDDCGETVSSVELPATGLHSFGEWTVTVNPTSTLNGTRTRTCTVCGHYETETIPAVGTTTVKDPEPASTTERVRPANTTEEDTDPPVVTDRAGKTNDLSRIFLIALIVIFIIIIIIIIASILAERKKERERKRRAAMRRKRSGQ